ncbi:MAG: hypothetical protein JWO11_3429 [Nocardioides sp.]|nr:hypothetical protein [Nocardioides sp.]
MMTSQHRRIARRPRFPRAVTTLGLAMTLVLGAGIGSATAARPDASRPTPVAQAGRTQGAVVSKSHPVTNEVKKAQAALASAAAEIGAGHYLNGRQSLAVVRSQGKAAQVDATALIGKPPTDPESDDPPGPPAVMAVLKLEHSIDTGVVALFDKMTRPKVLSALRRTLASTQNRRTIMLNTVIALPPEGAGADYSDDMPDTLGMFSQEVKAISAALATFKLTSSGKSGLTHALARAKATKTKMQKAFGGGERPSGAAT